MDSSNILLALDEQKKWRERRNRVAARIVQIERRRAYLLRELDHARRKASEYASAVSEPTSTPRTVEPTLPSRTLLR